RPSRRRNDSPCSGHGLKKREHSLIRDRRGTLRQVKKILPKIGSAGDAVHSETRCTDVLNATVLLTLALVITAGSKGPTPSPARRLEKRRDKSASPNHIKDSNIHVVGGGPGYP